MTVIVFDIDGTLIDSMEGILDSINFSCKNNNLREISKEGLKEYIGPPIKQYLPHLLGISQKDNIWNKFLNDFREHHDNIGYKKYILYPHTKEVLIDKLNKKNIIYIVTNKPYFITIKCLKYLKLLGMFNDIYALDNSKDNIEIWPSNINRNKVNYLDFIAKRHKNKTKYFIGDTESDLNATNNNDFNFIYATYGYGKNLNIKQTDLSIKNLLDINSLN